MPLLVRFCNSTDALHSTRNAVASSLDFMATPILWLVATPFLIPALGDTRYGLWLLVNGLIGFGGVMSFGLVDTSIKFIAKYRARNDMTRVAAIVRTISTAYAILGSVGGICLWCASRFLAERVFKGTSPEHALLAVTAFKLAGVGVFVRFLFGIAQSALFGFERYDIAAWVGIVVRVTGMAAGVALAIAGYGLLWVIGAGILAQLLGACAYAGIIRLRLLPCLVLLPSLDRKVLHEIMHFGFFTWLRTCISMAMQNMDIFLLGAIIGPSVVTWYSLGNRIPLYVHGLLSRAFGFLFPFTGRLVEQGSHERLANVYNKSTGMIMVLASSLILPVAMFGRRFIFLWMGPVAAEIGGDVVEILCPRFLLLPLSITCHHVLLGAGKAKLQAVLVLATSAVDLLAMLILIPVFGARGAALGLLCALPAVWLTREVVNARVFGCSDVMGTGILMAGVIAPLLAVQWLGPLCRPTSGGWLALLASVAVAVPVSAVAAAVCILGLDLLRQRHKDRLPATPFPPLLDHSAHTPV